MCKRNTARAVIIGVLKSTPNLLTAGTATQLCRLELDVDGETYAAIARGELAHRCSEFKAGQRVRIGGPLKQHSWTVGKRKDRTTTQVNVHEAELLNE